MGRKVSSWEKFRLLFWKNWVLQWTQKTALAFMFVIPILCCILTVWVRSLKTVTWLSAKQYDPIRLSSLKTPNFDIGYTPDNIFIANIVEGAMIQLNGREAVPYTDPAHMETDLIKEKIAAGLVFDPSTVSAEAYPKELRFEIRLPDNEYHTHRIYGDILTTSPILPDDNTADSVYLKHGFIAIQNAVSVAYITQASEGAAVPEFYLQRRSIPALRHENTKHLMRELTYAIIYLSYLCPLIIMTKYVASEREYQLKEIMKMIGVSNWIHWLAWFLKGFLIFCGLNIIVLIILVVPWANKTAVFNFTDVTLLFFCLTIYVIGLLCFSFMITVMFTRAAVAGAAVGIIGYIIHMPYEFLRYATENKPAVVLPWCLLINAAFGFMFKNIFAYEAVGEGAQWNNMFTPPPGSDIALYQIILIMLASCVLCMLICLYIEQISPGEFGVPRKWYFPLTASFWKKSTRVLKNAMPGSAQIAARKKRASHFESEPKNKKAGLVIKNLRKKFGSHLAVKDVTLNMYYDEITVLLGHNGAGKTTTISMLTGMIPPTSGRIIVDGYDLIESPDDARLLMGVCPQHNVLYEDMSVKNHLKFYARLKGVKGKQLEDEMKRYLQLINLEDKANVEARKLSGGQKRKLSIVCAMCGDTKVVFLDEPSAGMDPAARRHLWEVLQKEKQGRVILLTTHFMDEADLLGDHVAIMCNGEIKCYGSPFFLKKRYGSGYHLIVTKLPECDAQKVTDFIALRYMPGLRLHSDIGMELSYVLPENYLPIFEDLFSGLSDNLQYLQISGYGITAATLEEVFMKVGEEVHELHDSDNPDPMFNQKVVRKRGCRLWLYRWEAMLLKRAIYFWRKILLIVVQIISMAVLLALEITAVDLDPKFNDAPPLTFSLASYPKSVTVLESPHNAPQDSPLNQIADEYEAIVKDNGLAHKFKSTDKLTVPAYYESLGESQSRLAFDYIGAGTISDTGDVTAWFNPQLIHEMPLSLNLMHNALARVLIGEDSGISVTNYPLPVSPQNKIKNGGDYGWRIAFNLGFTMPFIMAAFIGFIVADATTRSKLLQLMSGLSIYIYWLANYIWDLLTFMVIAFCLILILRIINKEGYQEFADLRRYFILLLVFGASTLFLTYFMSFFFREPSTAFMITAVTFLFTGLVCQNIRLIVVEILGEGKTSKAVRSATRIFPFNALIEGFKNLYNNGYTRRNCATEQLQRLPRQTLCQYFPDCCKIKDYYDLDIPGILTEMISLMVVGAISLIGIILFEYRIFTRIAECIQQRRGKYVVERAVLSALDDDVVAEKQAVKKMSIQERQAQNLVLDSVSKHYKNFHAVRDISMMLKSKECFGLMGVNGAGKTTTFKMLTGDITISEGTAYIKGISIGRRVSKAAYREMGYCPQFDALIDDLTGRELIRIYCLLRGVPKSQIPDITQYLAYALGFEKHLNKRTKTYSGGNKRKLSTAIALIGGPSVVLLDEPTTGMDPASRRQMWDVICYVRDAGKSIVLTTHSMEECEALCTRVVIMVNGEFKCMGSIQHLKNKFSKGIVLKIKMKREQSPQSSFSLDMKKEKTKKNKKADDKDGQKASLSPNEEDAAPPVERSLEEDTRLVKKFIETNFRNAVLNEEYQGMLTYHIPPEGVRWSRLFGLMENNRRYLNYEDYTINQTSFEDIFLEFALEQKADTRQRKIKRKPAGCL